MMNVLDALRYRLTPPGTDLEGGQIDRALLEAMGLRGGHPAPQSLPPGLPLGVRDSILNQPSYGEGGVLPPRQPMSTDVLREFNTHDPDSPFARNDPLETELFHNRIFPMYDMPLPEGVARPDLGPPRPKYASPLNQFMQHPLFSQY